MPQAEPGPQALADAAAVPAQALLERFTNEHGLIEAVLTLLREAPLVLRAAELSDGDVRRMALRVKLPEALRAAEALYGANPLVGGHAPDAGAAPLAEAATLRRHAAALGVLEQPPAPLLKGRHLMQAGMRPGPAMGDLLKAAFEAQLDGAITSEAQALAWMAEALGRQPHLLESGS
jgi:tRNA nucleotidyltransferase (CCA-adding enzyme)